MTYQFSLVEMGDIQNAVDQAELGSGSWADVYAAVNAALQNKGGTVINPTAMSASSLWFMGAENIKGVRDIQ